MAFKGCVEARHIGGRSDQRCNTSPLHCRPCAREHGRTETFARRVDRHPGALALSSSNLPHDECYTSERVRDQHRRGGTKPPHHIIEGRRKLHRVFFDVEGDPRQRRALFVEFLEQALDAQMNEGKTTIVELMTSRELGDPFRRDAMKLPRRLLGKYKHTSLDSESATGQPIAPRFPAADYKAFHRTVR